MTGAGPSPQLSVIVPTYNRAELLRATLTQLTRQTLPPASFEVIVADDGSSDHTRAVVDSFAGTLAPRYHHQEDLGFRAGTARNAGARLATAPLLVFLDTAAVPGPEFLREHLRAHEAAATPLLVAGYIHAFNPDVGPVPGLADDLARMPPEQVRERRRGDIGFHDIRHGELLKCGFDLSRRYVPWMLFFTGNWSIRAEDFRRVGGFDDSFVGWGAEDLEFGYRTYRHGMRFVLSRQAWSIEGPHPRDMAANLAQFVVNFGHFLDLHPQPVIELGWALVQDGQYWRWEHEYRDLVAIRRQIRHHDVSGEIAAAVARLPPGERLVVVGCGGRLPDSLPPSVVMDFDADLVERALGTGTGGHTGHHSIGLRTPLPDQCADTVVITSRLAGLWRGWHPQLLAEAARIGRRVLPTAT